MEVKSFLSSRLQAARKRLDLSQSQLAEEAGLQQSAIAQFERGHRVPSVGNLRRLAVALDCTADYLLGLDDEGDAGSPGAAAVTRVINDLGDDDLELLLVLAKAMRKRSKRAPRK